MRRRPSPVTSGGDRIRLTWAANAATDPHFNGYVVYRSEGNVKIYQTVYTKVFECDAANAVHTWDDTTAVRGFNYYYYIQSKDDGSQNDVEPGHPLFSSLFLTLTTVPAHLLRPAGTAIQQVQGAADVPEAPAAQSRGSRGPVNVGRTSSPALEARETRTRPGAPSLHRRNPRETSL